MSTTDPTHPTTERASRRSLPAQCALIAMLAALSAWMLDWQTDPWSDVSDKYLGHAVGLTLLYLLGCAYWLRPQKGSAWTSTIVNSRSGADVSVFHASQTGFALRLAEASAESLRAGGLGTTLLPLDAADSAVLAHAGTALFIVSTTGEGDPPDPAQRFASDTMATTLDLSGLRYALLALGDDRYAHYCAFGRALDDWLRRCGATPLFDPIEVNNGDGGALRRWQHDIAALDGLSTMPDIADWSPPDYADWTLISRRELNPHGPGGPVHDIRLRPRDGTLQWTAGDLAEVGPRQDIATVSAWMREQHIEDRLLDDRLGRETLTTRLTRMCRPDPHTVLARDALDTELRPLPHREYSIASVPEEGDLRLLVRLVRHPDGSHGLGSGWLCLHAPIGGDIALRIRPNPGFHPAPRNMPLILIGSGTGLAGLRAHIAHRAFTEGAPTWLLFGERQRASDLHFADDLARWRHDGTLTRVDLAFSRDGEKRRYVQDALREAGDGLREWLDAGAHLLVCGSATGMATGVDETLRILIGSDTVDALRRSRRYRRDVY